MILPLVIHRQEETHLPIYQWRSLKSHCSITTWIGTALIHEQPAPRRAPNGHGDIGRSSPWLLVSAKATRRSRTRRTTRKAYLYDPRRNELGPAPRRATNRLGVAGLRDARVRQSRTATLQQRPIQVGVHSRELTTRAAEKSQQDF